MSAEEIAKLAGRVRWVEGHRRTIRRAVTIVVAVIGILGLPYVFGSDWPKFHARLMGIVLGLVLAFVIDLVLAGLLALWDLRHDELVRDRGMPRAILRRKMTYRK